MMIKAKIKETGEIVDIYCVEVIRPEGVHQILRQNEFELLQENIPAYLEHRIHQISEAISKGLQQNEEFSMLLAKNMTEILNENPNG